MVRGVPAVWGTLNLSRTNKHPESNQWQAASQNL